jgi:hypothetical protein
VIYVSFIAINSKRIVVPNEQENRKEEVRGMDKMLRMKYTRTGLICLATGIICISTMICFGETDSNFSMAKSEDAQALDPPKPALEYLGRWTIELNAPVWELGQTSDLGKRRIIPITGGKFEGPSIKGTILNNGADWQVVTKDGLAIIDTRYLLQTEDGAFIYLQTKGYRYGPPEVMAKLAAGQMVDPSLYYFRVGMIFEASSEKYSYLNRTIGIASAIRLKSSVIYDAYLIK